MPDTPSAVDNPLIWPIYALLQRGQKSWKLNELYAELQSQDIVGQLAQDPQRQLFKMNFLLMNALYQLRELLDTTQHLVISVLDIRLLNVDCEQVDTAGTAMNKHNGLADYYLDWQNFEVSSEQVDELLNRFWRDFRKQYGAVNGMARQQALSLFELDDTATSSQIRQQWRRLAFRWHPDRPDGDGDKFKALCDAWQRLKS